MHVARTIGPSITIVKYLDMIDSAKLPNIELVKRARNGPWFGVEVIDRQECRRGNICILLCTIFVFSPRANNACLDSKSLFSACSG